MQKNSKELKPALEDSKFKGVMHVNVDKTVEMVRD